MRDIFNYTDRKDDIRKAGDNPEIKISVKEKGGLTIYEPHIKLDKERKLSHDAKIFIQAYSNSGFVGKPNDFGTIKLPLTKEVEESEVGEDEIKFRLKIVSNDKFKTILASCYKIDPWGSSTFFKIGKRDQTSFIEYEIIPGEVPVLYFQRGYGVERDVKESPYLKGIIFSFAIREILQKYIIDKDEFSECSIRKSWIKKFDSICEDKFPEVYDEDAKQYIDIALKNFTTKKNEKLSKSLMDLMPDSSIELKDKLTFKNK